MRTLTMLLLFILGVCTSAQRTHGQESGSGSQRLTYSVKHGSAKDLAPVLTKHFKGAAEIQAVPDSPANALLISAPPAVLKEVATLLGQLDRKAPQIDVDVWLGVLFADGAAPKVADAVAPKPKPPDQQSDLRELTGPIARVLPKLAALKASGRVGEWKHFQGRALENQLFTLHTAEERSFVTAMHVTATGLVQKNIDRRQTGVRGEMTLVVTPDNSILVDLRLEQTRAQDGKLMGIDNGVPVHETHFVSASFKSKVTIPSGHAITPQAVTESRAGGTGQTVLVIWARVAEAGDRP